MLVNPSQGEHQNGRVCRSALPEHRNTTSNYLHVHFHSDAANEGTGFRLRYSEQGLGCGGRFVLHGDDDDNSLEITSPSYPHAPPPHAECSWVVLAPQGQRLQVDFLDQFYLYPSDE